MNELSVLQLPFSFGSFFEFKGDLNNNKDQYLKKRYRALRPCISTSTYAHNRETNPLFCGCWTSTRGYLLPSTVQSHLNPDNVFVLIVFTCRFKLNLFRTLHQELLSTEKLTHFRSTFIYLLKRWDCFYGLYGKQKHNIGLKWVNKTKTEKGKLCFRKILHFWACFWIILKTKPRKI